MDPEPEAPKYEWLDTPDGGLSLNRDDAVDVPLYLQELEAWVKVTQKRCK